MASVLLVTAPSGPPQCDFGLSCLHFWRKTTRAPPPIRLFGKGKRKNSDHQEKGCEAAARPARATRSCGNFLRIVRKEEMHADLLAETSCGASACNPNESSRVSSKWVDIDGRLHLVHLIASRRLCARVRRRVRAKRLRRALPSFLAYTSLLASYRLHIAWGGLMGLPPPWLLGIPDLPI
jgi:hypothetical protein